MTGVLHSCEGKGIQAGRQDLGALGPVKAEATPQVLVATGGQGLLKYTLKCIALTSQPALGGPIIC